MTTKLYLVSWRGATETNFRYFHCIQSADAYARVVTASGFKVSITVDNVSVDVPGIA